MDFRTMPGNTLNKTVILKPFDFVFEKTNDLTLWTRLFTEYETVEILADGVDGVTFRLKTFAEGPRPSRTWISTRKVERETRSVHGWRHLPSFPFSSMDIYWQYEALPNNAGVVLTWHQVFDVMPDSPLSKFEMEAFLNRSSIKQLAHIKQFLETWNVHAQKPVTQ